MIAFLQPLALLALGAAAIPAILHLLARRQPQTVTFPAVRYLADTEREQSRRIKLRHLLLLLLRTAALVLIALAAARPVARVRAGGAHAPTALALIVDNSLSAGAVVEGRRVADLLAEEAHAVLERLSPDDRLWLVTADGLPRAMTPEHARRTLDALEVSAGRLDLGRAVRAAAAVLNGQPMNQREVVVLSDLQRSALTGGDPVSVRVLAWRPDAMVRNRSLDSAWADPASWSPQGEVIAAMSGDLSGPVAVRLILDGQDAARAVATVGDRVVLTPRTTRRGWHTGRVLLDPDELRLDDQWFVPILVENPAAATAEAAAGRYVAAALGVLQEGGRAAEGSDVTLTSRLTGGRTVVFPPADPAQLGALNQSLAARGVPWRLGDLEEGEWQLRGEVGPANGVSIIRRYQLNGTGQVLARAGADAWLVRDQDVVIVASRLEEGWTELPVSAAFVPFLDLLINRLASGETRALAAAPAEVVELPPGVDGLDTPGGRVAVSGERRMTAPAQPGVYYLRGPAGDTVGALAVNHDARESRLAAADARLLKGALGPESRLLDARALDRDLFGGARRADLTGMLLIGALACALAELGVASVGGRRGGLARAESRAGMGAGARAGARTG